jgi:two-component system chemotaxis response regulator CheY
VVKIALARAGYDVLRSRAMTARKALASWTRPARCNLIVSDVNMPNMDGITFVTEVKKHPRHKFTPVIMLTTEGR